MYNSKKKHLFFSKSIMPLLGIVALLFLNATAYLQNFLFLDKLIVSSLILLLVFFVKIMNDNNVSTKD